MERIQEKAAKTSEVSQVRNASLYLIYDHHLRTRAFACAIVESSIAIIAF